VVHRWAKFLDTPTSEARSRGGLERWSLATQADDRSVQYAGQIAVIYRERLLVSVLPKNNLAYPARLSVGPKNIGTGFLCISAKNECFLVTARHVLLKDGLEIQQSVTCTSLASDLVSTVVLHLDCQSLSGSGYLKKHEKADVAVAKLGHREGDKVQLLEGIKKDESSTGTLVALPQDLIRTFDEAEVSCQIVLMGYPTSLGRSNQLDVTRPLLRHGIIAGKTADRRIVLDCPVYFGNSGSLVVEIRQEGKVVHYRAIGMAVEMIPFEEELRSNYRSATIERRWHNSGYSLVEPMDRILELF